MASSSTVDESSDKESDKDKEADDLLLVNACLDYEKSLSQIAVGGILPGANIQTVNINI